MTDHQAALPPLVTPVSVDTATLLRQIKEALNSGNPGDQALIFTNQLLALIKADPRAAARFAESPDAGEWRTELMRVTAQNWAAADPTAAANWVAQLGDSNERDTMLSCVCFQAAKTGVVAAIQILEQQGLNDRREVMLGNLAQTWAATDLPDALAWAGHYPADKTRDNLFLHIALAENEVDPKAAAQIVADQIAPGETQNQAAFSVLDNWAWQDPASASAWVAQFPDGEFKDRALQQISRITEVQASAR